MIKNHVRGRDRDKTDTLPELNCVSVVAERYEEVLKKAGTHPPDL